MIMIFLYGRSKTAPLPIEDGVAALNIAFEQPGERYSLYSRIVIA